MNCMLKSTLTTAAVAAALAAAPIANATNGYFKIGYGSKNRGMAGAGMAYGQDSLAPAVNPATLSGMGNRVDAGVELFNPQREGTVDATGMAVTNPPFPFAAQDLQGTRQNRNSGATLFAIPNFGISAPLSENSTVGLAVVANGGMNTRYNTNLYTDAFAPVIGQSSNGSFPSPPFPAAPSGFASLLEFGFGVDPNEIDAATGQLLSGDIGPSLGVNLSQVLIMPTIAYEVIDNHSVGASLVVGYQRFRAYGLGIFAGFSSDVDNLTNNGDDDAWGGGVKVGYQGNFGKWLSVGASYQSKIYMREFDNYAGLFAEEGDFDIPSTWGAGLAIKPTSKITIAADYTRINYSDTAAINNEGPTADEFLSGFAFALSNGTAPGTSVSNPLGTDNGWGFGWDDVDVYKIGVEYAYSPKWAFRIGYNYAESPYDDDQTLFNILAPGLVEQHFTGGFTWAPTPNNELTVTYMHALRNDQKHTYEGSGGFAGFSYGASNAMQQNALEASYAWKF